MKVITQEIKERIVNLKEQGKKDLEIADILKLNKFTVNYWASPLVRQKRIKSVLNYFAKKPVSEKRRIYKSRNEYLKNYRKKRYSEDQIFREKHKERVKEYQRRKTNKTPSNRVKGGLE